MTDWEVEPFGNDSVMVTLDGYSFVLGIHSAESFAHEVDKTAREVYERG